MTNDDLERLELPEPVAYCLKTRHGQLHGFRRPEFLEEATCSARALGQELVSLYTRVATIEVTDAERLLEFMLNNSLAVVRMANGKYAIYNPSVFQMGDPVGKYDTPRAALEAALGGGDGPTV